MEDQTRKLLKFYIEKAHKLRDFGFAEHAKSKGFGWKATRADGDEWIIDFAVPDVKEQDAFLLTFRIFIQENESISFPNIHGLLRDKSLSNELQDGIKLARRAYFNYLDSQSDYTVNLFDGRPTRGQMLKIVLYGGLAHSNDPETVEKFETWTRNDIMANLLVQEFTQILLQILVFINHISELCEKELEEESPSQ